MFFQIDPLYTFSIYYTTSNTHQIRRIFHFVAPINFMSNSFSVIAYLNVLIYFHYIDIKGFV